MAGWPLVGLSAPDHPHAMVGVFPYQSFLSHDELPTGRLERSKDRAADYTKVRGCFDFARRKEIAANAKVVGVMAQ
jgi:hypothetical protein